jgi:hypothetical protein
MVTHLDRSSQVFTGLDMGFPRLARSSESWKVFGLSELAQEQGHALLQFQTHGSYGWGQDMISMGHS